ADILQKELKTNLGTHYIPNPFVGQYQFHTEANIEQTVKMLDFKPRFEMEEGIKAYIPEIIRLYETEVLAK
ncbi:MAG: ADP-glyceromanno-heptose 6-epimerase, partial [Deltaproteobacteria bacterium HGW-Deltaproteobacteria-24]